MDGLCPALCGLLMSTSITVLFAVAAAIALVLLLLKCVVNTTSIDLFDDVQVRLHFTRISTKKQEMDRLRLFVGWQVYVTQ